MPDRARARKNDELPTIRGQLSSKYRSKLIVKYKYKYNTATKFYELLRQYKNNKPPRPPQAT